MTTSGRPIIVTTDLSVQGQAALPIAAEEAKRRGCPLILLHVIDRLVLPIRVDEMIPPQMVVSMQEQLEQDAKGELEKLREKYLEQIDTEVVILKGGARPIHEEIVEIAQQRNASLLVLTSRGHGALYHLFLGSTVSRILQSAPCPILVVPPTGEPEK